MKLFIREAREKVGISQKELARQLGIAQATLSGYESGAHDPKSDQLTKIASICGVTVDYLLGNVNYIPQKEKSPILSDEARRVAIKYDKASAPIKRAVEAVLDSEAHNNNIVPMPKPKKSVPLFGASFAAGSPEYPGDLRWDYYETENLRADFAIHINGNSMEPVLPDGSIAVGEKGMPNDGDVGAFWLDGGYLVKQVVTDSEGNVYLFSANRDRADADEVIWRDSGRDLQWIGRIFCGRVPLPEI